MPEILYTDDLNLDNYGQLKGTRLHSLDSSNINILESVLGPDNFGLIIYDSDMELIKIWNGTRFKNIVEFATTFEVLNGIEEEKVVSPKTLRDIYTNYGNMLFVNSNYQYIPETVYYVGVNFNGSVNLFLPENPLNGKVLVIKDESGNANNGSRRIDINRSGSQLIDGRVVVNIGDKYDYVMLLFRNNNWWVI